MWANRTPTNKWNISPYVGVVSVMWVWMNVGVCDHSISTCLSFVWRMKNSGRGGTERSCAIWGQFHFFYWRHCQLWPQVWLGGLSVAVGKLWCRSFVVWAPTQQSKLSNPSSSVEDVKWHTLEMLLETGTILLPCFSWTNWFVEWEDILQNWLVDASQMVSCI